MYEWSMSSIKVWLSISLWLLANSLFLSALKTPVSPLSKKSISHDNLSITDIPVNYQQQVFPLQVFHNIRLSSNFFVTFESIRIFSSLQYHEIPHFNPLTPISDQDRIPPYNIKTISSRQVIRMKKNISWGIIGWSNTRSSKLTS